MPSFTYNWSHVREWWSDLFERYELPGKPNLNFLEVGCYEGQATLWLVENILTHPTSGITVVDTFAGSPELPPQPYLYERFMENVGHNYKVAVIRENSRKALRNLAIGRDFIYIDGSHHSRDVLCDAVQSWELLKPGGLLVFDDYGWSTPEDQNGPAPAIDAFCACYMDELKVIHCDYQVAVEKLG